MCFVDIYVFGGFFLVCVVEEKLVRKEDERLIGGGWVYEIWIRNMSM